MWKVTIFSTEPCDMERAEKNILLFKMLSLLHFKFLRQ